MKRFLIAATALVVLATPALAGKSLTSKAVSAMLRANDRVQVALDHDVCSVLDTTIQWPEDAGKDASDMSDNYDFRRKLNARDGRSYDKARDKLHAAYAATNQTDGELEAIVQVYCEAVATR